MAYTGTSGSVGDTSSNALVGTLVTAAQLQQIYQALGATAASIDVTLGDPAFNVTQPDTVVLADDTAVDQQGLLAAQPDANGALVNIGQYATYVTNSTTSPVYVRGTGLASFVEYQGSGPATIDGGTSERFIADTETATGNLTIDASSAAGSYNYLIGGPGSDTINGSTSSTATTLVVAKSGPTTVNAGAGAATVYGGGATTMIGGTHAGQLFLDYTPNSADSMVAGSGGSEVLAVASGKNHLDDTSGNGTDTLYAGAGQDTLIGSSAGTTDAIGSGVFDVISKGADTVYVAGSNSGTDTVTGPTNPGVFDTIHFLSATDTAATLQANLAAHTAADGTATITFGTTGSSATQTVHFDNASHITFK